MLNMKKGFRIAILAAAIVLMMAGVIFSHRYAEFEDSLVRYRDIQIEGSRKEVLYRLGYPDSVLQRSWPSPTQKQKGVKFFPLAGIGSRSTTRTARVIQRTQCRMTKRSTTSTIGCMAMTR